MGSRAYFLTTTVQVFMLSCMLLLVTDCEEARGQSGGEHALIEEAIRLRDAGDYSAAIRVLKPYVEAHPDQAWVALLLAQTLYWAEEADAAQGIYEQALAHHPHDLILRLEYARMLVELLDSARARAILEPLQQEEATASEAEMLLGKIAYWQGDWSAAKRHFKEALRRNPNSIQARHQLNEIRAATAPWAHATSSFHWDNQPLSRLTLSAETGVYLTPLLPLSLKIESNRHDVSTSVRSTLGVEAGFKRYWPDLRLETVARAGFYDQPSGINTAWTWHVETGVQLPLHLTLRGFIERMPYFETTTSLSVPVMTRTVQGLLERDRSRGWRGQAAISYVRYPDENTVRTAYAWLSVPLLQSAPVSLHVGYSYANQDAVENRFAPTSDVMEPPSEMPHDLQGIYLPYYTPEKLQEHRVLTLFVLQPVPTVMLQVNGSYGVYATEDAPFFYADSTTVPQAAPVVKAFYSRRFYPWAVRSTLTASLSPTLTLSLVGEHQRRAYYETTVLSLKLVHRFTRLL